MTAIPYVRDFAFEYGQADQASPLVRRVVARNPGPFTFTGTGAHIVGHGEVAVIDPGPDDPAQIEAILNATLGERITHIFVTHSRRHGRLHAQPGEGPRPPVRRPVSGPRPADPRGRRLPASTPTPTGGCIRRPATRCSRICWICIAVASWIWSVRST